jgi:hypothetical protein
VQADGREFFRKILGSAAPAGDRRTPKRPPSSRFCSASQLEAGDSFNSTTFLLLSGKGYFVKRKMKIIFKTKKPVGSLKKQASTCHPERPLMARRTLWLLLLLQVVRSQANTNINRKVLRPKPSLRMTLLEKFHTVTALLAVVNYVAQSSSTHHAGRWSQGRRRLNSIPAGSSFSAVNTSWYGNRLRVIPWARY